MTENETYKKYWELYHILTDLRTAIKLNLMKQNNSLVYILKRDLSEYQNLFDEVEKECKRISS